MVNGKPLLLRETFEQAGRHNKNRLFWQEAVKNALGFTPVYETMIRHPNMYRRNVYKKLRDMVEKHTGQKFDDYVLSGQNHFPQSFAEFPTLGAVAIKCFPGDYSMENYDRAADGRRYSIGNEHFQYLYARDRNFMVETWSHGGIARYEADFRNWLSGMLPAYILK
jgi:hypothetical protein